MDMLTIRNKDEYVMQSTVRSSASAAAGSVDSAPKPLLANYGCGNLRLSYLDVGLMCSFNGGERTLQDFIDMG